MNLGRLLEAHAAATPDRSLFVVGPDGWGDALVSVRDEPDRWAMLGEADRVRAQAFSWAATGQRVADIYDEVAA